MGSNEGKAKALCLRLASAQINKQTTSSDTPALRCGSVKDALEGWTWRGALVVAGPWGDLAAPYEVVERKTGRSAAPAPAKPDAGRDTTGLKKKTTAWRGCK
jgi:hypothetical protein